MINAAPVSRRSTWTGLSQGLHRSLWRRRRCRPDAEARCAVARRDLTDQSPRTQPRKMAEQRTGGARRGFSQRPRSRFSAGERDRSALPPRHAQLSAGRYSGEGRSRFDGCQPRNASRCWIPMSSALCTDASRRAADEEREGQARSARDAEALRAGRDVRPAEDRILAAARAAARSAARGD